MNWFGRLFRRDPPRPKDQREWNEDWCVGDLAECIASNFDGYAPELELGRVYRVSKIKDLVNPRGRRAYFLFFGSTAGYACQAFRKLRPTIEAASDEFTAELRDRLLTGKPTHLPA
jgi:hypothetical protein